MTNTATQPAALPDFPDLESHAQPDDPQDLRFWLRMLSCANLIENEIRSRLRTTFKTTLPRFDMMAQLHRVPEGMKMSELSRYMMVTNGNITGITDQLEKEGMVERIKVASDRRSSLIRLTPSGKKAFMQMSGVYEEWIAALLANIPEPERQTLFKLLGQLKRSVHVELSSQV